MLTTAATITVTRPRRGLALVTLGGEVDLAALQRLRAVLARAGGCAEVVVEASGVGFIDCCALRPLLAAARTAAGRGGSLVLRDPSPAVARLITWCGLEEDLPTSSVRRRVHGGRPPGLTAGAGGS